MNFFSLHFPLYELFFLFVHRPPPPPPPHNFSNGPSLKEWIQAFGATISGVSEGGQALLMIAKIPSTIRNYKKTPEITSTLSSSSFWRRELVLRVQWIILVWNWGKFSESLPHWYHLHFPRVIILGSQHPRRPRGSQLSREKRRDESFQAQVEEPLGTDSHRTISKRSSECWLLIGHKKCFVLLCPIGEQFLVSSFREFVHDWYYVATVARFVHKACAYKGNFHFLLS